MAELQAPTEYRRTLVRITALALIGLRGLWARTSDDDLAGTWPADQALAMLMAAQLGAANAARDYVSEVLREQNLPAATLARSRPESVVGVAASGVPLRLLVAAPIRAAKIALLQGAPIQTARRVGGSLLDGIVETQIQDAARAIESAEITARPRTVYVRHLRLPSCARCAILAGRIYRWSEGFARHPRCDCFHVATTSDLGESIITDPRQAIDSGMVHGLSAADRKAIVEDGADPARVVNAHRGMATGQVGGLKLKTTTAGIAGGDAPKLRLRPESLYKLAGDDRQEAVRLLKLHGYLID